jgi:hypothetical protein
MLNGLGSHTSQTSTLTLLTFMQNHNPTCFDVRPDGNFSMNLPDQKFYVVIIAMSTDSHVYWYVEQVDASVQQIITTTAPSF